MNRHLVSVVALAAASYAFTALAQTAPTKTGDSEKGKVLTDQKGMTLYVFDKDEAGKSACNGPCATNWPPLMVVGDAKSEADYTVIIRDDGGKQWAYKGRPLYTWIKDTKPGDISGDAWRPIHGISQGRNCAIIGSSVTRARRGHERRRGYHTGPSKRGLWRA